MAYVPRFTNDLFISYSHIDDQAVAGSLGWVADFHRRLQIAVEEQLGAHIQIWRDPRIGAIERFPAAIDRQLRESAMLVAVLSPGYEGSDWCEHEAKGFVRGDLRTGDLWIGTRCRVIKIAKRPAGITLLPETGCLDFYELDQASGRAYQTEGGSERFKMLLTHAAYEIAPVLRAMRKASSVFLGTAPASMAKQRERLRRELDDQQYRLLVNPVPSLDIDGIERFIKECSLSILFDGGRDPSTEDAADATARQERSVAAACGGRLIVVSNQQIDETTPWPVEQRGWTSDREDGPAAQIECLVNPPPHDLKHFVEQTLDTPAEPRSGELVRIYLICDRQDHPLLQPNHARALRDYLLQRGYEVKTPLAEDGNAAEFSRDNRDKLKHCDGVVVFWGASRQRWFEQRFDELRKARGLRHGRTFKATGAFLSVPESPIKDNYRTNEVHELIKQFGSFDHTDSRLTRLLERLPPMSV